MMQEAAPQTALPCLRVAGSAEPVKLKISSGSANVVHELPSFERVYPTQNFQKSALKPFSGIASDVV